MTPQRRDRIPMKTWLQHKAMIKKLYIEEGKTLEGADGVREIMKTVHRFSANKGQYERRLKEWKFCKYRVHKSQISTQRNQNVVQHSPHHRMDRSADYAQNSSTQITTGTSLAIEAAEVLHMSPCQSVEFPSPSFSPFNELFPDSLSFEKFDFTSPSFSRFLEYFPDSPSFENFPPFPASDGDSELVSSHVPPDDLRTHGVVMDCDYPVMETQLAPSSFPHGEVAKYNPATFYCQSKIPTYLLKVRSTSTTFCNILDLPTMISNKLEQLSTAIKPFISNPHLLKNGISGFAVDRFYQSDASRTIQAKGVEIQVLFIIIFRLVNCDHMLDSLHKPKTPLDHIYKEGVEYLLSLNAVVLDEILNAAPFPYGEALEHGLFCAAMMMNSVRTVTTILKRSFNMDRLFDIMGTRFHPIEYCAIKEYVFMSRVLINHAADLSDKFGTMYINASLKSDWVQSTQKLKETSDLLEDLFECGLVPVPEEMAEAVRFCPSALLLSWVTRFVQIGGKAFFLKGALTLIVGRNDWDHSFGSSVKFIVEYDYPDGLKDSDTWKAELSRSLSTAIEEERSEIIEYLLSTKLDPKVSHLVDAVFSKNLALFARFLDWGLDPLISVTLVGRYPQQQIHTAWSICIAEGFEEGLELLKEKKGLESIGQSKEAFHLCLIAACGAGNEEWITRLLPLRKTYWRHFGEPVFLGPIHRGEELLVHRLISAGFCPGSESLLAAIDRKHRSLFKLLREYVTLRQCGSTTGFVFRAIIAGDSCILDQLLQAGAPVNHESCSSLDTLTGREWAEQFYHRTGMYYWVFTTMSAAILKHGRVFVDILLRFGARLNHSIHDHHQDHDDTSEYFMTPLAASIARQDREMLRFLLRVGADPCDNVAVYVATVMEETILLQDLLNACKLRYQRPMKLFGSRALCWAIRTDNKQLQAVLSSAADINGVVDRKLRLDGGYEEDEEDDDYMMLEEISPLGEAVWQASSDNGDSDALRSLSARAGNLNNVVCESFKDLPGPITPLLLAIEFESMETVRILVEAGADVSLSAQMGIKRTPLQAAVQKGNEEIIDYLLGQGAGVDDAPAAQAGATALQIAAIKGYIGIAKVLIQKGADVNAKPALIDGRTAFEGAAENGRIEMMLFLAQQGVDLHSNGNRQRDRAMHFAQCNARHAVTDLIGCLYKDTSKNPLLQS